MPAPSLTNPWDDYSTNNSYIFSASYGYPGSKIQTFIKNNYQQWNVKNWIQVATSQFADRHKNTSFHLAATSSHDLASSIKLASTFFGFAKDSDNIYQEKGTGEVLARISVRIPLSDAMEFYRIFGGGGNTFFFGGDFEAEKVDDSDWYDVKKFEITSLNFMDKLGRRQCLFSTL